MTAAIQPQDDLALLKTGIDTMAEGFALFDAGNRMVLCNNRYREMYGYSETESRPGVHISELLQKDIDLNTGTRVGGADSILHRLETFGKTEETFDLPLADGRWVQVRDRKLPDGGTVCIHTDITRHILTEEELLAAKDRAGEAESLLKDAIECISDGFIYYDAEDHLILYNGKFEEFYGFPVDKFGPEATWMDLERFDTERGYIVWESESKASPHERRWDDFERLLTDGRHLDIRQRPTTGGGIVSIHVDVTERKKTEEALKRAKEEAEAATAAKSQFVATVSHEVRTPMNGVLGMARLLLETPLSDEQREFAQNVVSSGEALLLILNDLLDISKLEAGKLEIETVPFAARQLAADTAALMTPNAREKGLELTVEVSPDVPEVLLGDVNRIRQIIFNLLSNAIKFTKEGSVSVRVSGVVGGDGKCALEVSVKDTGIGLTKENADKLFAPYVQASVEVARQYGGTGLGLAISRHLAEMMGGLIYVESRRGKGSTFTLTLALDVGSDEDIVVSLPGAEARAAGGVEDLAFQPRVLLVDDNEMNRKVALGLMRKLTSQISVAENGHQAVEMVVTDGPFDVVLMDRHMPVMDGIEATRRIRALDGPASQTPIIGLTAAAIRQEIDACLEAGMDNVVTKPIDPMLLKGAIARALEGAEKSTVSTVGTSLSYETGEAKTLDPSILEKLAEEHGRNAVGDFIAMFRELAPRAVAAFAEAAESGNLPVMTLHAHDLKSNATIVGLMRLSQHCRETELACKADRIEDARALGEMLPAVLQEAVGALSAREKRLPKEQLDSRQQSLAKTSHALRGTMNRMLGSVIHLEDGVNAPLLAEEIENHTTALVREGHELIELAGSLAENYTGDDAGAAESDAGTGAALSKAEAILIVEDDFSLARTLTDYLRKQGLDAVSVETGADMFKQIERRNFDAYVIDLTLPDEDGIVLIRKLRTRSDAPIIVQTGRDSLDDKLAAFELGSDDYVTKPVDPRELTIRLRSLLKRTADTRANASDILRVGDFTMDQGRHFAIRADGGEIPLTAAEFALIWTLAQAEGRILQRDVLVDAFATGEGPASYRAVDNLVARVRKKLGKGIIQTVSKSGYKCGWPVSNPG